MEFLLKILAHRWDLSPDQYWHLRLLCSLMLGPLLGVLYLVFFDKHERPRPLTGLKSTMRVNKEGQLLS